MPIYRNIAASLSTLFTAAALASLSNCALAGNLHVDCSAPAGFGGANQARGSEANPLRTLEELNSIRLKPGTRILFKSGSTCYGSFKPAAGSSGTAEAPIIVDAYGETNAARPVIAAGCRDFVNDPNQSLTESRMTPSGASPYASLCRADSPKPNEAAIHLHNVEYWEINSLELTNDALSPGARVGLLVQLEDFGTGNHYHVNNIYVHHVRGLLEDSVDVGAYKATGGILFSVTRNNEAPGKKQRRTNFNDVVVQNSEVYSVDAIGLSNRSAWQCRLGGAPCEDYPPYKGNPSYMREPSTKAASDYFPSTGIIWRNNRIHNVGGDGIIVRTAISAIVESNLVHDIWLRTPGNSAGIWAINTDKAVFRYNEVYRVRRPRIVRDDDGMAFDADMGARHSHFHANYSHDNEGGTMLFCGCRTDGFGNPAMALQTVFENNLSIDDGLRLIQVTGSERSSVINNIFIATTPVPTPIIENRLRPWKNEVEMRGNRFYSASGKGRLFLKAPPEGSYKDIIWSGNLFVGFADENDFESKEFNAGPEANTVSRFENQDWESIVNSWATSSGFRSHRYVAPGNLGRDIERAAEN